MSEHTFGGGLITATPSPYSEKPRLGGVTYSMSVVEAHDLGRYLYSVGTRDNDEVWKDGEAMLTECHSIGYCDRRYCPFPLAEA